MLLCKWIFILLAAARNSIHSDIHCIVEVLTVQHWDTVAMLQVHQESRVVGPHYNQCHQRSKAVIVSTRVLTSSNLAEQSSCAG